MTKPKTPAERKRAQREREQRLGMADLRLNLARTERAWIDQGATARGYEDRTEYLVALVRNDLRKLAGVTCHGFDVVAGRYENGGPVCKYSENFDTLRQAITAADRLAGYPWVFIQYGQRFLEIRAPGFQVFE